MAFARLGLLGFIIVAASIRCNAGMLPDITVIDLDGGYDATTQQLSLTGRAIEIVRGSTDRTRLFNLKYGSGADFSLTASIDSNGNLSDGQFSVTGISASDFSFRGLLLAGTFSDLTSSVTSNRLFADFAGRADGGTLQSEFGPFSLKLNGAIESASSFRTSNSGNWSSFTMSSSSGGSGNITSVVPEPGTAGLLSMTLLFSLRRRRRSSAVCS